MKKIIAIILMFAVVMTLTGCNSILEDRTHAAVTVTTSSGEAYAYRSWNGTGTSKSGQDWAMTQRVELSLEDGETATLTFVCDACGNEQTYEIGEPFAAILHCDCPEKISEGNAREYFAVCISFADEEEAIEESVD